MATQKPKAKPSANLIAAAEATTPASPQLSSADKSYLKTLVRTRGYSVEQAIQIGKQAGFDVSAKLFDKIKSKV
jgi:hypothetical protein